MINTAQVVYIIQLDPEVQSSKAIYFVLIN